MLKRTLSVVVVLGVMQVVAASRAEQRLVRWLFDGPIVERPSGLEINPFNLGGSLKSKSLHEWVESIDAAAKDREIAGAVMIIEDPSMGLAQVEEITRAIQRFRAKGKKVWCYFDGGGNGDYALACAADHITLSENSELAVVGLHAEMTFFKGLFDKIGLQMDAIHIGDFKSAMEPYTRTAPSEENARMINWLLDGIYERLVNIIAASRKLSAEDVKAAIDVAPLLSKTAKERKFVDEVGTFPGFKQMLRKEYGKDVVVETDYGKEEGLKFDMSNPFAIFQMFSEAMERGADGKRPGVAIVYIDGPITTGKSSPGMLGGGGTVGSTTIRAALEEARADDAVKAVVLRVDSPGGSAVGSDIMWDAATRLAAEKPLVVSMGDVAGSGGYYVSIPGDVIFAEETTLTASIGVVGGKLVTRGLTDWAGLSFTEFNRGKRAALSSTNRPWSDDERKWVEGYMLDVYEQFKGRIMKSRGPRIKGELETMAGGRVFTGKQAKELGLIDQIGGLHDAILHVAGKVGLGADCPIYEFPRKKDLGDILKEIFGEHGRDEWYISAGGSRRADAHATLDSLLRAALRAGGAGAMLEAAPLTTAEALQRLAPRQALQLLNGLRNAVLLQEERIGMFMPFDLDLR